MLQAVDIYKDYRKGNVAFRVLSNVNFNMETGDYVVFLGPSGSGKTALVNILGLLDHPTGGELIIQGLPVTDLSEKERLNFRRGKIGYLFSDPKLIEELTVYENVELPLVYNKVKRAERQKRVAAILGQMNILHRQKYFPKDLTGLEQQKVSIARATVLKPSVIIADEPTGCLNSIDGDEVLRLLSLINEQGISLMVFTHSALVASYGHRIIQMLDGHLVGGN